MVDAYRIPSPDAGGFDVRLQIVEEHDLLGAGIDQSLELGVDARIRLGQAEKVGGMMASETGHVLVGEESVPVTSAGVGQTGGPHPGGIEFADDLQRPRIGIEQPCGVDSGDLIPAPRAFEEVTETLVEVAVIDVATLKIRQQGLPKQV